MIHAGQREIVINGVRYNLAIRLDTAWNYAAAWENDGKERQSLGGRDANPKEAVSKADYEIHKAGLAHEPWLQIEMAAEKTAEDSL